jgi:hypothetical protein
MPVTAAPAAPTPLALVVVVVVMVMVMVMVMVVVVVMVIMVVLRVPVAMLGVSREHHSVQHVVIHCLAVSTTGTATSVQHLRRACPPGLCRSTHSRRGSAVGTKQRI